MGVQSYRPRPISLFLCSPMIALSAPADLSKRMSHAPAKCRAGCRALGQFTEIIDNIHRAAQRKGSAARASMTMLIWPCRRAWLITLAALATSCLQLAEAARPSADRELLELSAYASQDGIAELDGLGYPLLQRERLRQQQYAISRRRTCGPWFPLDRVLEGPV